jgi:DNA-binding GntR family transcriptional regulator
MASSLPTSPDSIAVASASARHRVRDAVQRLILSGSYQPGQRLVQQELAARFGVAQSVVRESLLELQFCGLVDAIDNLGMFVSGLSAQTLLDAYAIREMLEGLAARLCCEHASRAQLRELTEIAEQIRELGAEGDLETMSALDRQYHDRMIAASGNQLLARLTESYQVLGMFIRASRDMDSVYHEHSELVRLIETNQPDEAERLARRHVQAALASIRQQIAAGMFEPQTVGDMAARQTAERVPATPRAAASRAKVQKKETEGQLSGNSRRSHAKAPRRKGSTE